MRNLSSNLLATDNTDSYSMYVRATIEQSYLWMDDIVTTYQPSFASTNEWLSTTPVIEDVTFCPTNHKVVTFYNNNGDLKYQVEGSATVVDTSKDIVGKMGVIDDTIYMVEGSSLKKYTIDWGVIATSGSVGVFTDEETVATYQTDFCTSGSGCFLHAISDSEVVVVEENDGGFKARVFIAGVVPGPWDCYTQPYRFMFPLAVKYTDDQAEIRSMESLGIYSAAGKINDDIYCYITNHQKGSIQAVCWNHESKSWGDIFTPIPTSIDTSMCESRVTNCYILGGSLYLVAQFKRTDEDLAFDTYTMIMKSDDGRKLSMDNFSVVSNLGYRFFALPAEGKLYLSSCNRVMSDNLTYVFCGTSGSGGLLNIPSTSILEFSDDSLMNGTLVLAVGDEELMYNTDIREGARVKVYAGFKTTDGNEDILYGTYILSKIQNVISNGVRGKSLSLANEATWKLNEMSSPFYTEIESKSSLYDDLLKGEYAFDAVTTGSQDGFIVDFWDSIAFDNTATSGSTGWTGISVLNSGGVDSVNHTGGTKVACKTTDLLSATYGLTAYPKITSGSLGAKIYGWSIPTSGSLGDTVTLLLWVQDQTTKEITLVETQAGNWPSTEIGHEGAGDFPIIVGVPNLNFGDFITAIGIGISGPTSTEFYISRVELYDGISAEREKSSPWTRPAPVEATTLSGDGNDGTNEFMITGTSIASGGLLPGDDDDNPELITGLTVGQWYAIKITGVGITWSTPGNTLSLSAVVRHHLLTPITGIQVESLGYYSPNPADWSFDVRPGGNGNYVAFQESQICMLDTLHWIFFFKAEDTQAQLLTFNETSPNYRSIADTGAILWELFTAERAPSITENNAMYTNGEILESGTCTVAGETHSISLPYGGPNAWYLIAITLDEDKDAWGQVDFSGSFSDEDHTFQFAGYTGNSGRPDPSAWWPDIENPGVWYASFYGYKNKYIMIKEAPGWGPGIRNLAFLDSSYGQFSYTVQAAFFDETAPLKGTSGSGGGAPTEYVAEASGQYLELPGYDKPYITFFRKPFDTFNFSVQGLFEDTISGYVNGFPVSYGLVGLAQDGQNYVVGRYDKASQKLQILRVYENIEYLLVEQVLTTPPEGLQQELLFEHRDGHFALSYMTNTITSGSGIWIEGLTYDWKSTDGWMFPSDVNSMHVGIYGLKTSPNFAVIAFDATSQENVDHAEAIPFYDLDPNVLDYFPTSGSAAIGESVFTYTSKVKPDTVRGPYQLRHTGDGSTGHFAPPYGTGEAGVECRDWDNGKSDGTYTGYIIAIEGESYLCTDTEWDCWRSTGGVEEHLLGRARYYAADSDINTIYHDLSDKVYLTGGLVNPTFISGGTGYYPTGSICRIRLNGTVVCKAFAGHSGDVDATVEDLVKTLAGFSGANIEFPGDTIYTSSTITSGSPLAVQTLNDVSGLDLIFTWDSITTGQYLAVDVDAAYSGISNSKLQIRITNTGSNIYRLGLYDKTSGYMFKAYDFTLSQFSHRARVLYHENFVTVYIDDRWIHSFALAGTFDYDPTVEISIMTSDSSVGLSNVILSDVPDWREAVYFDLESNAMASIQSVVQERPIETMAKSNGALAFNYEPVRSTITQNPKRISRHKWDERKPSEGSSDGIVNYATDVKIIQSSDFLKRFGFSTKIYRMFNLTAGAIRAARIQLKRFFEGREVHTIVARPNLQIECGDILSVDYVTTATNHAISFDIIVEAVNLSGVKEIEQGSSPVMTITGRKYDG